LHYDGTLGCLVDVDAEDEGYTDCKEVLKGTERKVLQKGDFIEAQPIGSLEGFPEGNICELSRYIGQSASLQTPSSRTPSPD